MREKIAVIVRNRDLRIILTAILYCIAAQVGIFLSFVESKAAPLWPPAGLALALTILFGRKIWPAVMIGGLIANSLVFLNLGMTINSQMIYAIIVISLGYTLEALFGFYLLKRFVKDKNPFLKASNVFFFLGVAITMSIIGATIGALGLLLNNIIASGDLFYTMSTWWISSTVSVLTITPFVISLTRPFKVEMTLGRVLELLVFVALLSIIMVSTSLDEIGLTVERAVPFLIVPFLLWLGFNFNLQTTTTGIIIASFTAIYLTISKASGPFYLDTEQSSLFLLQIFVGVISISTIILHATVNERIVAQKGLEDFNDKLESNVAERTAELNAEIRTRKKAEERIKVSNKKLRKANVELDNFVYSVSHDLRAPIASVLGLVNLGKKEEDIEMMRRYLQMIGTSAEQQDSFIKDILDLSRNSRLDVYAETIQFEPLINEIFDQLKYGAEGKNIIKEISISQESPFKSDVKRLKVIFNNIISNAIRYSSFEAPHVKIDIYIDEATAKIQIADNGIGIPKKHQKNIFKMFYRASEDNAGSGLGLYIVKETIEKLRGSVQLESKEEVGTTFYIEVPNMDEETSQA